MPTSQPHFVVLISKDLFFPSSLVAGSEFDIRAVPQWPGERAARQEHPGPAEPQPRVILIDLDSLGEGILAQVPALQARHPAARIVGFGSHVHSERLARARQAGCDEVVTRGQLSRGVRELLRAWCELHDSQ